MATKRKHRTGEAWVGDPFVPIDGARLEAAIEVFAGKSVNAFAGLLPGPQATNQKRLNAIINGSPPRTCRKSLRDNLARLLALPAEALATRAGVLFPGDFLLHATGGPSEELPELPRSQFAMLRVGRRIMAALLRDIERGRLQGRAVTPAALYPAGAPMPDDPAERLDHWGEHFLPYFFSAWRWRLALFPAEWVGSDQSVADWEAIVPPLAGAIEAILDPWLADEMPLDYDAVPDLVAAFRDLAPRTWLLRASGPKRPVKKRASPKR